MCVNGDISFVFSVFKELLNMEVGRTLDTEADRLPQTDTSYKDETA